MPTTILSSVSRRWASLPAAALLPLNAARPAPAGVGMCVGDCNLNGNVCTLTPTHTPLPRGTPSEEFLVPRPTPPPICATRTPTPS